MSNNNVNVNCEQFKYIKLKVKKTDNQMKRQFMSKLLY